MTMGYCRLQALWRSRRLAFRYQFARKRIIGLQAHCRGHLVRSTYHNYLIAVVTVQTYVRAMIARRRVAKMRRLMSVDSMPEHRRNKVLDEIQNEEAASDKELQRKKGILDQVKETERMRWPMNNDPSKMMERLFGTMARSGTGAPTLASIHSDGSRKKGIKAADGTTIVVPDGAEEADNDDDEGLNIDDEEDLSQYKFTKFAQQAFQSGHNPNFSKKALKDSLLTHEAEEDKLASQAVWLAILRFMGDLAEPKYPDEERDRDKIIVDPNRGKRGRVPTNLNSIGGSLRGSMASGLAKGSSFAGSQSNLSMHSQDTMSMTLGQVMGDTGDGNLPQQVPISTRIFETFGKGALRRVTTEEVENMEDDEDLVPVEHRVVSQTLRRKTKLFDDLNARLEEAVKGAAAEDAKAYKNFGTKSMAGTSIHGGHDSRTLMSGMDDTSTLRDLDGTSTIMSGSIKGSLLGSKLSGQSSKRDRYSRHSAMSDAASTIGASSIAGMSTAHTNPISGILGANKEWNANHLEKWFKINRPTSNLEKLHFIIGYALLRPKIRDEIYCQICKQLTNNNSKSSLARGWLLLSLCCGCFTPSDRFIKYLFQFIKDGPLQYGPFIEARLKRTVINGARRVPPSAVEIACCKSKKPIKLTITFMDGTTKTVLADSSTTAKELADMLCEKVGITDKFGFSMFIALFDKVMSIGNTNEHVLDAISTCEQYVKELGGQERCAPWRLFFKKEIFTPWHDTKEDKYATNMTYNQIIRGVKFGEYRYEEDEGYAAIAAKQWYIDFGQEIQPGKLTRLVNHYIPEREIEEDDETRHQKYWVDLIIKCHRNSKQVRQRWEPLKVKQDIVHSARFQWPLLFSRFYEVKYLNSTATNMPVKIKSGDNIILAVTWTKIFMVDYKEKIIGDFTYPEITNINCNRDDDGMVTSFYISTIQNDEYSLSSPESEDIRDLVTGFLDGLKRRSKYAVAMQANPNKITEGSQFLSFTKGDLLVLEKPWGKLQKLGQAWSFGTNATTKQSGDFPMDCVYVLPALTKPPKETLEMFTMKNDLEDITRVKNKIEEIEDDGSTTVDGFFCLESYCRQYCREGENIGNIITGINRDEPWEFSKNPIKKPLHLSIQDNEDMSHEACEFFQAIMKYMGDYPSRRPRHGNEMTDLIFSKPLQSEVLRDELYVQLCKQTTKNISDVSEERGWELLWLAAGLFAPSTNLLPHVNKYFKSRKDQSPMIADCLNRLQKTIRVGDRKFAPHLVEVEAICGGWETGVSRENTGCFPERISFPTPPSFRTVRHKFSTRFIFQTIRMKLLRSNPVRGPKIFVKVSPIDCV